MRRAILTAAVLFLGTSAANAGIYITEWMYNSNVPTTNIGEFVELLNTGPNSVDMTNWSFDDNHAHAGTFSLAPLGILGVGQFGIITDDTAANFRATWNLDPSFPIAGGNSVDNLGRSDEINIYDDTSTREDWLTYNDQGAGSLAGPRTNGASANFLPSAYGQHTASLAIKSVLGDQFGSHNDNNATPDVGSPGAVPEPASLGLCVMGGALLMRRKRASV